MAITRPLFSIVVGQSYGRAGYSARAAYTMFSRAVSRAIDASAAAILAESGVTVAPGDLLLWRNRAVDGSAIIAANAGSPGYWVENDTTTAGPLLTATLAAIAGYSPTKPHFVLYSHGEQDATSLVSVAVADDMKTALTGKLWPSIRSAINSGAPTDVPIFVDMPGPRYAVDELDEYTVRDRLIDAVNEGTNIFWGIEKYALPLDATTHPSSDVGYRQQGAHAGRKVAAWLVDHDSVPRGPSITGVSRSGNRLTVAISVPAGKTLVKPAAPIFFGAWNGSTKLSLSGFSWSGNDLSFDCSGTPTTFRYPARTGNRIVDLTSIVRLTDPSDPLYTDEIGFPLESCKTTAIA